MQSANRERPPPKRPEDLANYTLLRAEDEYWKPWFEAVGLDWPEPERGTTFADSSHLLQAAADGQGVALARRTLIGKDLRNGVLMRPFEVEVPSPRRFYLVYPPRLKDSPKLAAFRRWLKDEIDCDNDASMSCATRPPAAEGRTAPAQRQSRTKRARRFPAEATHDRRRLSALLRQRSARARLAHCVAAARVCARRRHARRGDSRR